MRTRLLPIILIAVAGCSDDPEPEVTENPAWGPGIKARQEAEAVADFAQEQLNRKEEALRRSGAGTDQGR